MTKTRALIAALSLGIVTIAGNLSAQTALRDVAVVRDGIIHVGMAYEISQKCDSLNARIFRGLGYLQSLKNHARDLGYSSEEIDAYVPKRLSHHSSPGRRHAPGNRYRQLFHD